MPSPPSGHIVYSVKTACGGVSNCFTSLQTAINTANPGDIIELEAGATFTEQVNLPKKNNPNNNWIIIRSSAWQQLPPQGQRINPALHQQYLPTLTAAVAPTVTTANGASYYRFIGIDITTNLISSTTTIGSIVAVDLSTKTLADVPHHIVFDRSYIHAKPTTSVQRCILANAAHIAIIDSYLDECHANGFDSQAIVTWNGPGPFKIVNNFLAGAGENVMFGGADPGISGLVPSDIEFFRNYVYKPLTWQSQYKNSKGVVLRQAHPTYAGIPWTVKNSFETKNVARLHMEGNIFDGSWPAGQTGTGVLLKSANQGGNCNWCGTRDVIFRNNIIRNASNAIGLAGKEGGNPYPAYIQRDVLIENNLFEDIGVAPYNALSGGSLHLGMDNGVINVSFKSNTLLSYNNMQNYIQLNNNPGAHNFEYVNNIAPFGVYGIRGVSAGGEIVLTTQTSGTPTYTGNVVVGTSQTGYPTTQFATTMANALATGKGANIASVRAATAGAVSGVWGACTDTSWNPDASNLCDSVRQTSNCYNSRTVQGGVTCGVGQTCNNNQCIATPVCGNSIVETGESCDTGAARGICPATCSATCQTNTCAGKIVSYEFNEGSGTTSADSSGNGRTATISGATWTSGKNGNALQFSGANSFVTVADFAPPTSFTLQAWIYPTTVSGDDRIILTKGMTEYEMRILGANYLLQAGFSGANLRDSSTDFSNAANLNKWHHYAYTYESSSGAARLYHDGSLVNSTTAPGLIPADTSNNLIVGKSQSTWGNFIGTIDDVRIWNVARTQAEIQQDIGGSTCVPETDAMFCTRLGAACGVLSGADNCLAARTVNSCGICQSGYTCNSNTCTQNTAKPEDRNGDGIVNVQDIIVLVGDIKTQNMQGDINKDNVVDIRDLVLVAKAI